MICSTELPTFLFTIKHCKGIHLCKKNISLISCFIASASGFEVENLSFLMQNMHAYLYWMIWSSCWLKWAGWKVWGPLHWDTCISEPGAPAPSTAREWRASWSWIAGKPAHLALQNPILDDGETRRIFSLTKSEMLKQTATLSPETCMVKGAPRQKRKGKKKQMKCYRQPWPGREGGAQAPGSVVQIPMAARQLGPSI